MSAVAAMVFAEMLTVIPFFPAEAGARAMVADEIACMCGSPEDAQWLVRRMRRLYRRWPGLPELRLVLCSGRLPLDGLQANCESEVYPDGIPSETEQAPLAVAATPVKRLAGAAVPDLTAARSLQQTISALAVAKDLNRSGSKPPRVPSVPVVQITEANRITQADIDRALAERRREREEREVLA